MPNWCVTTYCFEGLKAEVNEFYDKIKEWTAYGEYDDDKTCLSNILTCAGFDVDKLEREMGFSLEGNVTYLEKQDGVVLLETQTAWAEDNKVWDLLLEKYFDTIGYYYWAEELGLEYVATNDIYGKYFDVGDYYILENLEDAPPEIQEKYKAFKNVEPVWTREAVLEELRKILNESNGVVDCLTEKAEIECTDKKDYETWLSFIEIEHRED